MNKTKTLKNHSKTICGIKRRFYTVLFNQNTGKYYFYLNRLLTSNDADLLIYKGNKKAYNHTLLVILGVLLTLLYYLLVIPAAIILNIPVSYIQGGWNFILNHYDMSKVWFFGYVNIFIIIGLVIYILIK